MIKKKNIHFNSFADFNTKKLSANADNTTYTLGVSGEIVEGTPDVPYQSIVFVKDTRNLWTHGSLYETVTTTTKVKAVYG